MMCSILPRVPSILARTPLAWFLWGLDQGVVRELAGWGRVGHRSVSSLLRRVGNLGSGTRRSSTGVLAVLVGTNWSSTMVL